MNAAQGTFGQESFGSNADRVEGSRIDTDDEIAAIFAKRPEVVVFGDYSNCWQIPRSSWEKIRDSLHRNGFAAYGGYSFLTPASQPRTAESR